jgi:hypothetical protein
MIFFYGFLLFMSIITSYTYLETMKMKMTSNVISSLTLITLTHLTGRKPILPR